jgi:hypothetical protein
MDATLHGNTITVAEFLEVLSWNQQFETLQ